jgi:hypothetical protein
VLGGTFSGTVALGDRKLESAGGTDIFVAKFDRTGKVVFAERYGAKGDEAITDVAVDPAGNIILGGKAQGAVEVAGMALRPELRGEQQRSLFVAKLDPAGKALWIREVAVGNDSAVVDVAVAPDGKIATGVGVIGPLLVQGKPLFSQGESISIGEIGPQGQQGPTTMLFSSTPVACAHAACVQGAGLNGFCDWCVGNICAQDPYCCNTAWDAQCVTEVATICGQRCDCNTCSQGQPINAYACPCVGNVCARDPYCCMHGWDATCVQEVGSFCGTPCR